MWNSFCISFQLKNTYYINSILYFLGHIPGLKKIIRGNWYGNNKLKNLCNILYSLSEIVSIFMSKFVYMLFLIFLPSLKYPHYYLHILFFLTILGMLLNTQLFVPSKDKYYAICLLQMDAQKYALSHFFVFIFKSIIGFMPFVFLFTFENISLVICFIIPFFIASSKILASTFRLYIYKRNKKIIDESEPSVLIWITIAILSCVAYSPFFTGIAINNVLFIIVSCLFCLGGVLILPYIFRYPFFGEMYREVLTEKVLKRMEIHFETKEKNAIDVSLSHLNTKSNRKGFAYLHDLFMERHRKILLNSSKKNLFRIFIFTIFLSLFLIKYSNFKVLMQQFLLPLVCVLPVPLYMMNTGHKIAKILFMHCDNTVLIYDFYREKEVILQLFKERLKSIVKINFISSVPFSLSYCYFLFITNSYCNFLFYFLLFLSINAISIFFSIHHLVMYYLFQPYTIYSELKSISYQIVHICTFIFCFLFLFLQIHPILFCFFSIGFTIIYILISFFILSRFAYKMFKLRV